MCCIILGKRMAENDDSYIEKVKEENTKTNKNSSQNVLWKYGKFILSVFIFMLLMIGYLLFGTFVLYSCKVSQANVLPTDEKCAPYTNNNISIEPLIIDANVNHIGGQAYSTKIQFPYDINKKHLLLDWLLKLKQSPDRWALTIYYISLIEGLIRKNYQLINTGNTLLNYLPEWVILIISPLYFALLFVFGALFNIPYSIYLWFINFSWFFKENKAKTNEPSNWQYETLLNPYNIALSCGLAVLQFIMFFVVYLSPLTAILPLIVLFCFITTLLMKSKIKNIGQTIDQDYGILKLFSDLLRSNSRYIMMIVSFFMVLFAFSSLGVLPGVFSILTCIALFFGLFVIKIYSNEIPSDLTAGLKNPENKQAKRECKEALKETGNFLYNLLGVPQTGGRGWDADAKKLLKKIKKVSNDLKQK